MALLAEKAVGYFSSIGPLAKKILDDQENLRRQYGSEWNRLSSEKQDCLVDQFFIDEEVLEKYQVAPGDDDEERPDCFPKLKIPCGEKICVDFDNDQGWTWRDEHSGPFSWKTRSQQDLTLGDDEDEGIEDDASDTNKEGKGTPLGTPKVPKKPGHKKKPSHSPKVEPKGSLAFKPERSIWDSPFLAADRGLDSAYPSSHSSDQSKGSDESDHGDMINKFGMAIAFSDAVRESKAEELNAITKAQNKDDRSVLAEEKKEVSLRAESSASLQRESPGRESIGSTSSKSSHKKKPSRSSAKDKRWKPSSNDKTPEAEQALMSELSVSVGSTGGREEPCGQVSPVYIEDPGESSSDFDASLNSNSKFLFSDILQSQSTPRKPENVVVEKPEPEPLPNLNWSLTDSDRSTEVPSSANVNTGLITGGSTGIDTDDPDDDWKPDIFGSGDDSATDAPKTGFDFLDNW